MNKEIKEIINDLQRVADRKCYPEDVLDGSIAQEWVDYITNLQEKYEEADNDRHKLFEQKEKAIEYIKCGIKGDINDDRAYIDENALLSILEGDDKE